MTIDEDLEAERRDIAARHALRYPDGCGPFPGHHCDACHARLEEPPHPIDIRVTGRRIGTYRGRLAGRCLVAGCGWTP